MSDIKLELDRTKNAVAYDVVGVCGNICGEITNCTDDGTYKYQPPDFTEQLSADELDALSVELRRLNASNQ